MSTLVALKVALLVCALMSLAVGFAALTSQRRGTYLIGLILAAAIQVTALVTIAPLLAREAG